MSTVLPPSSPAVVNFDPAADEWGMVVRLLGSVTLATPTIDANNTTADPLAAGATFTGAATDVLDYSGLSVFVFADQAGTLYLDFSTDGVNWDYATVYSVNANDADHVSVGPFARYFRLRFVNGATPQTTFRLQTILRPLIQYPPTTAISGAVDFNGDAILVKAAITGRTTAGGGSFVDVKVAPSGAVQVGGAVDQGAAGANAWPVGLAALSSLAINQVTVGLAAVQLDATPLANRKSISVKALPANTGVVYVGKDNAVTTAVGYPLSAGDSIDLDLAATQSVYGIADAAAQGVAVLEIAGTP